MSLVVQAPVYSSVSQKNTCVIGEFIARGSLRNLMAGSKLNTTFRDKNTRRVYAKASVMCSSTVPGGNCFDEKGIVTENFPVVRIGNKEFNEESYIHFLSQKWDNERVSKLEIVEGLQQLRSIFEKRLEKEILINYKVMGPIFLNVLTQTDAETFSENSTDGLTNAKGSANRSNVEVDQIDPGLSGEVAAKNFSGKKDSDKGGVYSSNIDETVTRLQTELNRVNSEIEKLISKPQDEMNQKASEPPVGITQDPSISISCEKTVQVPLDTSDKETLCSNDSNCKQDESPLIHTAVKVEPSLGLGFEAAGTSAKTKQMMVTESNVRSADRYLNRAEVRTTETFKNANVDAINGPLSSCSDLTKSSLSSANITSLQTVASRKTSECGSNDEIKSLPDDELSPSLLNDVIIDELPDPHKVQVKQEPNSTSENGVSGSLSIQTNRNESLDQRIQTTEIAIASQYSSKNPRQENVPSTSGSNSLSKVSRESVYANKKSFAGNLTMVTADCAEPNNKRVSPRNLKNSCISTQTSPITLNDRVVGTGVGSQLISKLVEVKKDSNSSMDEIFSSGVKKFSISTDEILNQSSSRFESKTCEKVRPMKAGPKSGELILKPFHLGDNVKAEVCSVVSGLFDVDAVNSVEFPPKVPESNCSKVARKKYPEKLRTPLPNDATEFKSSASSDEFKNQKSVKSKVSNSKKTLKNVLQPSVSWSMFPKNPKMYPQVLVTDQLTKKYNKCTIELARYIPCDLKSGAKKNSDYTCLYIIKVDPFKGEFCLKVSSMTEDIVKFPICESHSLIMNLNEVKENIDLFPGVSIVQGGFGARLKLGTDSTKTGKLSNVRKSKRPYSEFNQLDKSSLESGLKAKTRTGQTIVRDEPENECSSDASNQELPLKVSRFELCKNLFSRSLSEPNLSNDPNQAENREPISGEDERVEEHVSGRQKAFVRKSIVEPDASSQGVSLDRVGQHLPKSFKPVGERNANTSKTTNAKQMTSRQKTDDRQLRSEELARANSSALRELNSDSDTESIVSSPEKHKEMGCTNCDKKSTSGFPFRCRFCVEHFLTLKSLRSHLFNDHQRFICVGCGTKFSKAIQMKEHVLRCGDD